MKNNYGSIHSIYRRSESGEDSSVESKFKSVASQCCGVLAADFLKFTTSTFIGFHIILIAELHEESSEIAVTMDQLTWIASLNFLVPIGSILNGFLTQRIGSRFVMMSSSFFFITTWLFYYFATNFRMILAARVLHSITSGAIKTSTSTYITEITLPNLRGSFLASYHLASTFGMFFSLLMGSFLHWKTIALINLIFPILSIIIILVIPDSPMWLASKGRFEEAEVALSWLRGWVKPKNVRYEYRSLLSNFQKSIPETSSSSMSNTTIYASGSKTGKLALFLKPYLDKSFYLPLATMTAIYLVHFFSGVTAVLTFSMIIFKKMSSPLDQNVAPVAMGAMRVAGAFIILFCIRLTGKRRLIFSGLLVTCCSYLLISGTSFGIQQGLLNSGNTNLYSWISPIAMIVAIFANAFGVDSIVHMLNSEIFPVSIRYIGSSIGSSIGAVVQSIMSKAFLYMLDALTLPGIFLYLGIMNLVAIFTYYYIFPETEGRSLQEIEDHYRGTKRLDDRSHKQQAVIQF